MQKFTVTYTDGHTEEIRPTMRALCQAEEYAQAHKWADGNASIIRKSNYIVFAATRFCGRTTLDFDAWLDTVADISNAQEAKDPANPTA